jgi:hypothetical protein
MGIDDGVVDFVLESGQVVIWRGVAIEAIERDSVEEAGTLVP